MAPPPFLLRLLFFQMFLDIFVSSFCLTEFCVSFAYFDLGMPSNMAPIGPVWAEQPWVTGGGV